MTGVGSGADNNREPLSAREHLLAVAIYAGIFGVLALGYVVPSVTAYSVPRWLVVVGLWSTYVATGSIVGCAVAWLSVKLTPAPKLAAAPSLTRRCALLVTGMLICALVTWLMEVQLGGMTGTARAALIAPAELPRALVGLALVQAPGLVVLVAAIALGFRSSSAAGLAKSAAFGAFLVGCSQVVILALGIFARRS